MQRKQFTFYWSYYEALQDLQPEDQLALVMAITAYALEDKEPELEGMPAMAFKLIRPTLDSGRKRADRIYKKRAEQEDAEKGSWNSESRGRRQKNSSGQDEGGNRLESGSGLDEDGNRLESRSGLDEDRNGREGRSIQDEVGNRRRSSSVRNENENENRSDPDVSRNRHESGHEKENESEAEVEKELELESEVESELELESESEEEKDSYISEEKKTERHAGARARDAGGGFDRFWSVYPRKVGKQVAQRAWNRLGPDEALTEEILGAVEKQKGWEQWSREGGRYIPNPATWLNQGRWEDEAPAQPGKGGRDIGDSGQSGAGAEAESSKWHIRYTNTQV